MAMDPLNSSNLEQLGLKGLILDIDAVMLLPSSLTVCSNRRTGNSTMIMTMMTMIKGEINEGKDKTGRKIHPKGCLCQPPEMRMLQSIASKEPISCQNWDVQIRYHFLSLLQCVTLKLRTFSTTNIHESFIYYSR